MNQQNKQIIKQNYRVDSSNTGQRVDQFLAKKFPEYSRGFIQKWIADQGVLIDKVPCKAKNKLKGFETIEVYIELEPVVEDLPQKMDLDIIYEDDHVIVINKPAGMLVHPGSGQPDNTLMNGLLAHNELQSNLPRAGIVHRLDMQTSGLMVVAKTSLAYNSLINQLKDHTVTRKYVAISKGYLKEEISIDKPIGRHKTKRTKMAVIMNGKAAMSHVTILERFKHYTMVQVQLETGRTHQIRVHLHFIGHQLVGDPVYGNPQRVEPSLEIGLKDVIRSFPRQALHAQELCFDHPKSNKLVSFNSPLPDDLSELIEELRDFDSQSDDQHSDNWDVYYPED